MTQLPTIVVTGASGFLGRHVVEELVKLSFDQVAITRENSTSKLNDELIKVASVHSGSSVEDFKSFFTNISGPVVLVHLAAHYASNHTSGEVSKLIESNIHFPSRLVDALSSTKPGSVVINISTVFQHFESKSYSPISLYAATKESFTRILDFYAESELLNVADITLGDTYGPNDVRGKLIDLLIASVGSSKVLNLGSGRQNMSIMHISDAARGIAELILNYKTIPKREVWRVQMRPTDNVSVRELIKIIEQISGKKIICTFDPSKDRKRELYSPVKGLNLLPNYSPLIDLETGISAMIADSLKNS